MWYNPVCGHGCNFRCIKSNILMTKIKALKSEAHNKYYLFCEEYCNITYKENDKAHIH